jgi:hypothetical protein
MVSVDRAQARSCEFGPRGRVSFWSLRRERSNAVDAGGSGSVRNQGHRNRGLGRFLLY